MCTYEPQLFSISHTNVCVCICVYVYHEIYMYVHIHTHIYGIYIQFTLLLAKHSHLCYI